VREKGWAIRTGALTQDDKSGRRRRRISAFVRPRAQRHLRPVWRAARVVLRSLLIRWVSAQPRRSDEAHGERHVTILLFSAWGMGGTTRTTLNVAAYLGESYDVEILSVIRRRKVPFFGEFPPSVTVTALDDQRREYIPGGLQGVVRRLLRSCPSVLVHTSDRRAGEFNLWTDVKLLHKLRGRPGFLIGTRPALNLMVAELSAPGNLTIGEEHMHLRHHALPLRKAMQRLYPRLDAFIVLTEGTLRDYDAHLNGTTRLARIPNSVPELGGDPADLGSKIVLAAGRLVSQKGFDLLILAFAQVAAKHPDWRLQICGRGKMQAPLQKMIEAHGLTNTVTMVPPVKDMGAMLAKASVFALSSRFEGFPLVLLEAMSKAMGVVSFNCPTGPADIIDDHRNGVLVPAEDVDALAAGLLELVEDEELRRRCAAAAFETARGYRMESVGPLWGALLNDLWETRTSFEKTERVERHHALKPG
jgi:glycosyltransferase involved in cell wall biosynthesis